MTRRYLWLAGSIALGLVLCGVLPLALVQAQQAGTAPPLLDPDDIGGVVTSSNGPEAGVWVIAETTDLPTRFSRTVVTDDRGRYVVPDLPKATYKVWVRGYGLVDSKPVNTTPGRAVNLTALPAPSPRAAAQYYPASYWLSLLELPPPTAFPMEKEGINDQLEWAASLKNAIQLVQLGDKATRQIPEQLGRFKSSVEAWEAWSRTGESPLILARRIRTDLAIKLYADWTDRIAAGEYPREAPPRPLGVERNIVITQWDWGTEKAFIHDIMTTDTRKPTVNANGLVYGEEQFSSDYMTALDPKTHTAARIPVPMPDPNMPTNWSNEHKGFDAEITWGEESVRPAKMRLHNQMIDADGRVWMTGKFRNADKQPDFCRAGSSNESAKYHALPRTRGDLALQVILYEPATKKFSLIDSCFGTHHLQFAEDANHTLWFSGDSRVAGFLNTKLWLETRDLAKAQGWCPYILDTNGNGKADAGWTDVGEPIDPTRDARIERGSYGMGYNPVDGSIWFGNSGSPGAIVRVHPGASPPATCLTEVYNPPPGTSNPKGVFVERASGIVWAGFAASGHFASFDRRKCKVLNGPTATGNHCPEGWTVYPVPGPKFKNAVGHINTDWYYLNWVDQFNTLGLGNDVPLVPGSNSDSMIALLPEEKQFVTIRVPYPLGFFARGMDGRIDDPNAGWKGRGLWSTFASIAPWNMEGGKGMFPKAVKFQVRPDPLAH